MNLRIHLRSIVTAACLAVPLLAGAQEPGIPAADPPEGFAWVAVGGTKSALLRPDGWNVTIEEQDGTIAAFVTLEDWQGEEKFETGLSFNFITGVLQKTGAPARTYAASIVVNLAETYETLIEPSGSEVAPGLFGYVVRYRAVVDGAAVIVHAQLLADNVTDNVRFAVFESPEDVWDEMWEYGQTIVSPWILER